MGFDEHVTDGGDALDPAHALSKARRGLDVVPDDLTHLLWEGARALLRERARQRGDHLFIVAATHPLEFDAQTDANDVDHFTRYGARSDRRDLVFPARRSRVDRFYLTVAELRNVTPHRGSRGVLV